MPDSITDLLDQLRRRGDEEEAILALGLLLETRHPDQNRDLVAIVGEELANRRLKPGERRAAISGLAALLEGESVPSPLVVGVLWALGKTQQASAAWAAVSAIDRFLDDPQGEPVVRQALQVLMVSVDAPGVDAGAVRRALAAVAEISRDDLSVTASTLLNSIST